MQIVSTSKRIDIAKKPLQIQQSLFIEGGVPPSQTYDSASGIYSPDYTIVPLVLQPIVGIVDADEVLPSGRANSMLADIEWTMIQGGTATTIMSATPGFRITASGENAGRLEMEVNAAPRSPITLRFKAKLIDPRTSQAYAVELSQLVECHSSRLEFSLTLSMPQTAAYNPLRSPQSRVVEAALKSGIVAADPARTAFVWEKKDGAGWREIDPAEPMDYDAAVANGGTALEIRQDLMGSRLDIRCTAYYDNTDTAQPDPLSNGIVAGQKTAAIIRKMPQLGCDYGGVPANISPAQPTFNPKAIVADALGDIDLSAGSQGASALSISWCIARNKANGTLSYSEAGYGPAPEISSAPLAMDYGAVLEMVVEDRGPLGAWADSDGSILTDSDGSILLI